MWRTAIHVRRIPKDVRLRDVAWAWIVIDTHRANVPLVVKVLGAVCKFEDHIRRIDLPVEHEYVERYGTRIGTLDSVVQENHRLRSTDDLTIIENIVVTTSSLILVFHEGNYFHSTNIIPTPLYADLSRIL